MWLPTKAQIDAASRHAITAAGMAVTIFGLQAKGVSMDDVKALITSLGDTVATLVQLIGAIGVMYGAFKAAHSASPTSQIDSVKAIAIGTAGPLAVDAQKALIEATSAVAQDNTIPKSEDAKNTLIAATIALPQVKTIITDSKTADASPSSSVIASADLRKVGT